jgi:hypothetical protein
MRSNIRAITSPRRKDEAVPAPDPPEERVMHKAGTDGVALVPQPFRALHFNHGACKRLHKTLTGMMFLLGGKERRK